MVWLATLYKYSPPVWAARESGAGHRSLTTHATLCFLLTKFGARLLGRRPLEKKDLLSAPQLQTQSGATSTSQGLP